MKSFSLRDLNILYYFYTVVTIPSTGSQEINQIHEQVKQNSPKLLLGNRCATAVKLYIAMLEDS